MVRVIVRYTVQICVSEDVSVDVRSIVFFFLLLFFSLSGERGERGEKEEDLEKSRLSEG